MHKNKYNINLWLIGFPRKALWVFSSINILAMYLYSGGTYWDHSSADYSFTNNFLSDLGRTTSFSGKNNFLSSQLFNFSLIIAGFIYSMFYFYAIRIFSKDKYKVIALLGSFFGILGGLSLIGVGFTPSNLYFNLHVLFAHWLFRFMFIASLFYSYIIYKHPKIENYYSLGYIIFSLSILIYILISEFGPPPNKNEYALFFQVVSQKLILIIFMIAIYIQTIGIEKIND